jgi:hypothetical protein
VPVFWLGIRGDLTPQQQDALDRAGITVEHDRESLRDHGVPVDWEALRTFARVSAAHESEAKQSQREPTPKSMADRRPEAAAPFCSSSTLP